MGRFRYRKRRWQISNEEILAAANGEKVATVRSQKVEIADSDAKLAEIFRPLLPLEENAELQRADLTELKAEPRRLLDGGKKYGVDYLPVIAEVMRHRTNAKQTCSAFMQKYQIPSSYKLPLQQLFIFVRRLQKKKFADERGWIMPTVKVKNGKQEENDKEEENPFERLKNILAEQAEEAEAEQLVAQKTKRSKKETLMPWNWGKKKTEPEVAEVSEATKVQSESSAKSANVTKSTNLTNLTSATADTTLVQSQEERATKQPLANVANVAKAERADSVEEQQPSRSVSKNAKVIQGVQFDKHLFRHLSGDAQQRLQKTFASRLQKLESIFRGNVRAAGNDFKKVRGAHGKPVLKRRLGDQRLSMVLKDGVLTLLAVSHHDRQMNDIRKIHRKNIGYVYYDTDEFLEQLAAWDEVRKEKKLTFGEYLAMPQHFVYDADQQAIIDSGERAENLSIIGNAGAGKSVVGLKWLRDTLQKSQQDCLYLTMSENLVYTLAFELAKEQSAEAKKLKAKAKIQTTFAFLRDAVKKCYPQIPERSLLNAEQSFRVFGEFWQNEVDWTQFWHRYDKRFAGQSEETTKLAVWREIHGIIKGAVPQDISYNKLYKLSASLDENRYQELLRQEHKDSLRGVLWEDMLFRTVQKYQAYLQKHELYDDNDIARLILQAKKIKRQKYAAVFLDECQDLTQRELLAIFYLLGQVKVKRMASDRCQMVQPTYFSENWMRTTCNAYTLSLGQKLQEAGLRPKFLHYNYRSSRCIIAFQNYIVQYFRTHGILTLRQDEMQAIQVPPMTGDGLKPVWVKANETNQRLLISNLWQNLDASELQAIFAFDKSPGKADFPQNGTLTDILHCKGMEYPAVLLYNVLSEMQFDPVMAWKYFYVGATRSNQVLILYEKDAEKNKEIHHFLQEAQANGLIDYCEDLRSLPPDGSGTWLGYLYRHMHERSDQNRLETAENALNFGQYELALNIYEHEGKDEAMIAYCRGKVHESKWEFHEAIDCYASLSAAWTNRGRTRHNSVEGLLKNPVIEGTDFLAAYLLYLTAPQNMLSALRQAWQYKYGKDKGFYAALFAALHDYDFAPQIFHQWVESIKPQLAEQVKSLQAVAEKFPVARKD